MFKDRLQAQLLPAIHAAFKDLFQHDLPDAPIAFQTTRPEFEGDVTINVFPFLKISGKGPEATATALAEYLQKKVAIVQRTNVVKGFLNILISDDHWHGFLQEAKSSDILSFPATGEKVMVEYSSPNTNKPLHLGHLRNNFLGHSVSRILSAVGNEVIKVQIINDRGIHICKSMLAWQEFGDGETPETSDLKGDKLVGKYYVEFDRAYKRQVDKILEQKRSEGNTTYTREQAEKDAPLIKDAQEMLRKWEKGNPEVRALWKKMNGWVYDGFSATYARMGVEFDKLYYESETYVLGKEDVLKGVEEGIFFRKEDGSVWVDLSDEGLDQKVLLRSDGTSVYMTQDVGTAIKRFEEFPGLSRLIYTVGNEQDHHFKVLFAILRKLGFKWAEGLYHLSYGMVDLPSGKMKSREGTVVDADDLMEEVVNEARRTSEALGKLEDLTQEERSRVFEMIGMAALKYFLLKVDPKKRMLFDPAASIDINGHTGPFIQYTHARIRSLLRRTSQIGKENASLDVGTIGLLPEEREVIKLLHQFPAVLDASARSLDPSVLANHCYELVKAYNTFYQNVPVLKEEDVNKQALRIDLSLAVANATKKAMWCLGIEVPDRM